MIKKLIIVALIALGLAGIASPFFKPAPVIIEHHGVPSSTVAGLNEGSEAEMRQTLPRLKTLLAQLKATAGVTDNNVTIRIIMGEFPNAWIEDNGRITITSAEIYFSNFDMNWIAGTLSHELGHYVLGHTGHDYPDSVSAKKAELAADIFGLKLMHKAGYNCHAQADYFKKVMRIYGKSGGIEHPDNDVRAQVADQLCTQLRGE